MLLLEVDHSRQCLRQLLPSPIDSADSTGLAAGFTAEAQLVVTTLSRIVRGSYVSS
jgi:hypothetical protein